MLVGRRIASGRTPKTPRYSSKQQGSSWAGDDLNVLSIILLTFWINNNREGSAQGRKDSRNFKKCPKVPLFDFDLYLAEVSR